MFRPYCFLFFKLYFGNYEKYKCTEHKTDKRQLYSLTWQASESTLPVKRIRWDYIKYTFTTYLFKTEELNLMIAIRLEGEHSRNIHFTETFYRNINF